MVTRRRKNRERRAYNRVRRAREGVGGLLYAEKRWDGSHEWCSLVKRPSIERREAQARAAKCEAMWANALANGWVTDDYATKERV